jgi:uncharacterized cupredoxin-like copper-binding protein
MKTLIVSLIAAIPLSLGAAEQKSGDKSLTEKTTQTLSKAGEKTKEAGNKLIEGTKKAVTTTVDAITPDADAHKVDVKVSENRLDLPKKLQPGKTGFVVHNDGMESHSFEIKGEGLDKKFLMSVPPNETKVLHVDLKPGSYKAFCPEKGPEHKGMSAELSVK